MCHLVVLAFPSTINHSSGTPASFDLIKIFKKKNSFPCFFFESCWSFVFVSSRARNSVRTIHMTSHVQWALRVLLSAFVLVHTIFTTSLGPCSLLLMSPVPQLDPSLWFLKAGSAHLDSLFGHWLCWPGCGWQVHPSPPLLVSRPHSPAFHEVS